MITIENLTFTYPGSAQPALREVSVCLQPGIHAFVGPSGGGKSTFLRLINGLVPHSTGGRVSGRVEILGRNALVTPTRMLAGTVGFLFQDVELQSVAQTVERDVAFGLENLGLERDEISRRIGRALTLCGIAQLRTRKLTSLSGGERQLAGLASVIAMETPVICLDEPLAQLDDECRIRTIDVCRELAATGTTILVAEHHQAAVLELTDSVFSFEKGRLSREVRNREYTNVRASRPRAKGAWTLESADIALGGKLLLKGLSVTGHGGQVMAVSGHNGSGKTTLLRTLAGLHHPVAGELHVDFARRAYLPQNPASLLWRKSIRSEIEATLKQRGGGSADAVLDEFSLTPIALQYPADVSTGERQRAALATVLCGSPDLLLLDEPTRGMDHHAFDDLVRAVESAAGRGASVVIATHDRSLVDALADTELQLGNGTTTTDSRLLRGIPQAMRTPR